jgi:hypothetical protein
MREPIQVCAEALDVGNANARKLRAPRHTAHDFDDAGFLSSQPLRPVCCYVPGDLPRMRPPKQIASLIPGSSRSAL